MGTHDMRASLPLLLLVKFHREKKATTTKKNERYTLIKKKYIGGKVDMCNERGMQSTV